MTPEGAGPGRSPPGPGDQWRSGRRVGPAAARTNGSAADGPRSANGAAPPPQPQPAAVPGGPGRGTGTGNGGGRSVPGWEEGIQGGLDGFLPRTQEPRQRARPQPAWGAHPGERGKAFSQELLSWSGDPCGASVRRGGAGSPSGRARRCSGSTGRLPRCWACRQVRSVRRAPERWCLPEGPSAVSASLLSR